MDITEAGSVGKVFGSAKAEAVLHLAAMAGVRPSIERPGHYAEVNVTGTVNLLEAAARNGVKKFLFASSSSVYGNNEKVPFGEEDAVEEPISPYAATKRAGELMAHTYWHLYKLPVFCLRFFTVYGPRQRPDLAIHKFTRLISEGKPVPFYGDGSTSRDYTYVEDIVAGVNGALDRCDRFRIYNLGGSRPISLKGLVEEIEGAVGKKAVLDKRPMQMGDVERTYADVGRAGGELGYEPRVTIREGIKRFVEWFREEGDLYR
jgi:UDP-glucuronate 4-epimerase